MYVLWIGFMRQFDSNDEAKVDATGWCNDIPMITITIITTITIIIIPIIILITFIIIIIITTIIISIIISAIDRSKNAVREAFHYIRRYANLAVDIYRYDRYFYLSSFPVESLQITHIFTVSPLFPRPLSPKKWSLFSDKVSLPFRKRKLSLYHANSADVKWLKRHRVESNCIKLIVTFCADVKWLIRHFYL